MSRSVGKLCVSFFLLIITSCGPVTSNIENAILTETPSPPVATIFPSQEPVIPTLTQGHGNGSSFNLAKRQYILYQTFNGNNVSLIALSLDDGDKYSLYSDDYPSQFELSSSLERLANLKEKQIELIDFKTGSTKIVKFDSVCSSAAWSPDESKLAVTCGDVFVVGFSDLKVFQLTSTNVVSFGGVSWSPDGKWLAYNNIADPYGDDPYDGIYITDTTCLSTPANCKEQTRFFSGSLYQFVSSTWSPDSSKLAFLALGNIFILDVDFMEIDFSIEPPHENLWDMTGLAWSPDGSQFAISNELEQRIIVLSSKNGEEIVSFPIAGNVLSWIDVP